MHTLRLPRGQAARHPQETTAVVREALAQLPRISTPTTPAASFWVTRPRRKSAVDNSEGNAMSLAMKPSMPVDNIGARPGLAQGFGEDDPDLGGAARPIAPAGHQSLQNIRERTPKSAGCAPAFRRERMAKSPLLGAIEEVAHVAANAHGHLLAAAHKAAGCRPARRGDIAGFLTGPRPRACAPAAQDGPDAPDARSSHGPR